MNKNDVTTMLTKYANKNSARFHMPGHKGTLNPYDVTEICDTDDLNNPQTYYKAAQRKLSESYNSASSFFLVNGATSAIHAMIKYTSMYRKGALVVSRNCHKSVFSACILYKVKTIVINEKYDDTLQCFTFDEQLYMDVINSNPDVCGLLITSPDYFGRVVDLSNISEKCKKHNILLLVDEAHGAHFSISEKLPESASSYADMWAQSPHKTLNALTQSAFLHIGNIIDVNKVKYIIKNIQTTSPNSLLIESMDSARQHRDSMQGKWETRIQQIKKLAGKLNTIKNVKVMDNSWAKKLGYYSKDITRLVIDVSEIGNGLEISNILASSHNIFMEMSTFKYIVGIMTPWDNICWDEMLYDALKNIVQNPKLISGNLPTYPNKNIKVVDMIDAENYNWLLMPLDSAINKVAITSIGAYPPGIPLVLPGEVITKEIVDYMLHIKKLGGELFGCDRGNILCFEK